MDNDFDGMLYGLNTELDNIQKAAVKTIIRRKYRFVLCLNAVNGEYMIYLHNKDKGIHMIKYPDYNKDCEIKVKKYLSKNDRYSVLKDIKLEGLLRHLEDEDSEYTKVCEVIEKDGRTTIQQMDYVYIDYSKKLILITCTDITELIQKEHEKNEVLKRAIEEVKSANDAKSRFLSRMSHDMRTPMNGIIGLTTLTLEREDLSDEVRQNMEDINESGKFLLNLINDTLDMNKIESNRLKLNMTSCSFDIVLKDIVSCVKPMAEKKKIIFDVVCVNTFDYKVVMDKMRVQQMFVNLLSNAVKYTKEKGKIRFEIKTLKSDDKKVYVRIMVKDNGIGMSEQFLPKIFIPFEQETNETTQTCTGSGLGMAIVKNLVELMGGRIEIDSKKNVGTCIKVYLDFYKADDNVKTELEEKSGLGVLKGKRILLCEDNSLNAKVAYRMLREKGMVVDKAENGRQAVDIFSKSEIEHYDMILMDVRMPVMDGLKATAVIRELDRIDAKEIPIIAMTANAYVQDINECIAAGMDDHIAKPIEMEEMFKTIVKNIR